MIGEGRTEKAAVKIDTHAHVFGRPCALAPDRRYDPEGEAPIDAYLGLLDDHHVSHAVLVQPSFLGTDNGYLLSALAVAPQRLRGIAVVDPAISEAELNGFAEAGIVGIRLNLLDPRNLPDLKGSDWCRLFGRVAERGWIVEVQADGADLAPILDALKGCGAAVVVDHFGRVTDAGSRSTGGLRTLLEAAEGGRLWVKLSAPYRFSADSRAVTSVLLANLGAGRLLWGSDWPWTQNAVGMTYAKTVEWLAEWVDDETERRTILGDTPARLFGLAGNVRGSAAPTGSTSLPPT